METEREREREREREKEREREREMLSEDINAPMNNSVITRRSVIKNAGNICRMLCVCCN